jgi:adenylate kinase
VQEALRETKELSDELQVQLVKRKLCTWGCRNQGFVLDGFPETQSQAKALFGEDLTKTNHGISINPEFVVVLEASDDFVRERAMNGPSIEEEGIDVTERGTHNQKEKKEEKEICNEEKKLVFE